jgi:hypothetical protein
MPRMPSRIVLALLLSLALVIAVEAKIKVQTEQDKDVRFSRRAHVGMASERVGRR